MEASRSHKKIAVVGAGIYGTSIAITLARSGYQPVIFDPLGPIRAASHINQLRVHAGYHYPRSEETIKEIQLVRSGFVEKYRAALVDNVSHYYAIPISGSKTCPEEYESICEKYGLRLKPVCPDWINFSYIAKCYEVEENIFDPDHLRTLIQQEMSELNIQLIKRKYSYTDKADFDFTIYATYGLSDSHINSFKQVKLQVAEKVLTRLPDKIKNKSLVVIDGPFTAFDPYGKSEFHQFGSAKYTNHWETNDPAEIVPIQYRELLNKKFNKIEFSNFELMRHEAMEVVPLVAKAKYLGSKFTLRLVEDDPATDRRILRVVKSDSRTIHVFSGKVVSAVKAAQDVLRLVDNE